MNNREKIVEVMRMVQKDCEAEAMSIDGKPFTAKTVAEQFGNLLAEVKTVARAVELLAEDSMPVLGTCVHGKNLDTEFCPWGCRR